MVRLKFVLAALALSAASSANAQNYPNRAITIVVPFAQGGLTDVPVRLFASVMQEKLGVPVVVENKTGGSGSVGATHVLRSEPDGYTLHANAVADTQNLHYIKVPYNAVEDFAHIGKIVEGPPLVLVIDAKLPHKTVAELVAGAKANPEKYSFGTSGPASSPVIALNQLNAAAGTKIQEVPYRGSGQAATSVVTGAIQGTFTFYSSAKPLVDRRPGARARGRGTAPDRGLAECADHGGGRLQGLRPQRLRRACGAGQDAAAGGRVSQQGAERGGQHRAVQEPHGRARHDDLACGGEHPGELQGLHGGLDHSAGRARQACGGAVHRAAAGAALASTIFEQAERVTMAKITRINPSNISKPFASYSHVVTARARRSWCSPPARSRRTSMARCCRPTISTPRPRW